MLGASSIPVHPHPHCRQSRAGRLDGVLPRPLPGGGLVARAVGLVDVGDLGDERVVGVGVGQHAADGQQDLANGQSGAPLVAQDVEADAAVAVDVGVVDAGGEVDLGRLEGVVGGEVDGEEEDAAAVGRVARAHDGGLPVELRTEVC
jgi:hypothetical protein